MTKESILYRKLLRIDELIESLEKRESPFNLLVEQMKDEFKLTVLMTVLVVVIMILLILVIHYRG